ncbi:MAG: nucleotide exchange factor GrpE [Candidatus Cloacimonadota bacterium]|nr:MAG: nucleotide exchange factor GrpE [Candidatus Cloacimonadota bacterium]
MLTQSSDIERLYETSFIDVNEDLYNALIRQVKTQRDTLNLLHLQRKSQGEQNVESILAEKDRLIFSLQTKIDESLPDAELKELQDENFELEERVKTKNKKIRELEESYNLHLNRLNDELSELKSSPVTTTTTTHENDTDELEKELQNSKHQIHFLENQIISLQEINQSEENSNLQNQVHELQQKLSNQQIDKPQNNLDFDNLQNENKEIKAKILQLEALNLSLNSSDKRQIKSFISSSQVSSNTLIELHNVVQNLLINNKTDNSSKKRLQIILNDLLSQNQLEVFDSLGETINLNSHQIIDTVYCTDQSHNIIFKEISKGFLHQGNIIQKAQVIVAKNPYYCTDCDKVGIQDSKFCFHCGTKLLGNQQLKNALPIVNDQQNSNTYLDLGEAFLNKKEYKKALLTFEKSQTLSANNLAIIGMTKSLEGQSKYKEALEIFERFDQNASGNSLKLEIENRILAKIKIVEQLQYLL